MAKLYRLKVAPRHRYSQLSIRTKAGKKKVTKDTSLIVSSDDLLKGEEFALLRYREQGHMIVEEMSDDSDVVDVTDQAWVLAQEHEIDLSKVEGSGTKGRITVKDVKAVIAAKAEAELPDAETTLL